MAGTYKTPGVYVEEISKLPPSVAEVDTAVPAFIGYTEIAKRYVDDDLIKIPTRIKSLLEYEQYFGQGPSYANIHIYLDTNNAVDSNKTVVLNSIYNLYDSIRLFFDNGGGVTYITSVGKYSSNDNDATRASKITDGLTEVRKFDEPTLLLFPDAVNIKNGTAIDWDKLAAIQQAALSQCADLGDRFAILDIANESNKNIVDESATFRNKIGMNNLKYGAAYAPFVKTVYDKTFLLRDIMKNLYDSGSNHIELKALFSDSDLDANGTPIKSKLDDFKKTYTDNDAIVARLALFSGGLVTDNFNITKLDTSFQGYLNAFNGAASGVPGDVARLAALKAEFEFLYSVFAQLEGLVIAHAAQTDATTTPGPIVGKPIRTNLITNPGLKSTVEALLGTNLKSTLQTFINLDFEAYRSVTPDISNAVGDKPSVDFTLFTDPAWLPAAATNTAQVTGADITSKGRLVFTILTKIY